MERETAQKAARWWADTIKNGAKLDNGDKSDTGFTTHMLATIAQAENKITEEQALLFEEALVEALLDKKDILPCRILGCDYHPDRILAESAEKAGINPGMTTFPWKTNMWIKDGEIEVSEGYGAPPVKVE